MKVSVKEEGKYTSKGKGKKAGQQDESVGRDSCHQPW